MSNEISIPIIRFPHGKKLPLPDYATPNSAGMDLYAAIPTKMRLATGQRETVPTGIGIGLIPGLEAQVRPRSGLAERYGITILNAPGTIDADYRGEIKVLLHNTGDEMVLIERGMRIAQLIIAPVMKVTWNDIAALNQTQRGAGGFGSTGV